MGGISAIKLVAGELRLVAEIFPPRFAETAVGACPAEPGYSNPLTGKEAINIIAGSQNLSNDLMSGNDWHCGVRQFPVYQMQVRPADRAGEDSYQDLSPRWLRNRSLNQAKRLSNPFENHGVHEARSLTGQQ